MCWWAIKIVKVYGKLRYHCIDNYPEDVYANACKADDLCQWTIDEDASYNHDVYVRYEDICHIIYIYLYYILTT